jgi:hypothetical protein
VRRRWLLAAVCSAPLARAVEPVTVTAGTVSLWLAEGAVNYMGGQAMASIMGDPSIRDVKKWIRAAIEEIKSFIAAELQRQITDQYINETIDRIEGMRLDLLDYGASKDQRILLQQFGSNMNTWIAVTKRFGLPSVMIYANAVSMKMLVLSAFVKDHGERAYVERLEATAEEGSSHLRAMISENNTWLDEGVASVGSPVYTNQPRFIPNWDCGFTFRGGRDGAGDNNRGLAEQKCNAKRDERIAAFKREKEAAQTTLHLPLLRSIEGWNAAVTVAKKLQANR